MQMLLRCEIDEIAKRVRDHWKSDLNVVTINLHIRLKSKYLDKKKLTSWQSISYLAFCLLDSNN